MFLIHPIVFILIAYDISPMMLAEISFCLLAIVFETTFLFATQLHFIIFA